MGGGNSPIKVTAIEYREDIANVYRHYFPNDKVIVTDAHQYLLDHYAEYDFIWTSPPCPTHSRSRFWRHSTLQQKVYPDMALYQEVIFLKHYFKGKYCVENVKPFYEPMYNPKNIGRHLFWTNFRIGQFKVEHKSITEGKRDDWRDWYGFDLSQFDIQTRRDQIYRNCVDPEVGLYVLNCALGALTYNPNQPELWHDTPA